MNDYKHTHYTEPVSFADGMWNVLGVIGLIAIIAFLFSIGYVPIWMGVGV